MTDTPRDYQLNALYNAESVFRNGLGDVELGSTAAVEAVIQKVMSHPLFVRRYGDLTVQIRSSRRMRNKATCEKIGRRKFLIKMAPEMRTRHFALHELAHAVTWDVSGEPSHGPVFCDALLRLVRWATSVEHAYVLAHCFDLYGVEYD